MNYMSCVRHSNYPSLEISRLCLFVLQVFSPISKEVGGRSRRAYAVHEVAILSSRSLPHPRIRKMNLLQNLKSKSKMSFSKRLKHLYLNILKDGRLKKRLKCVLNSLKKESQSLEHLLPPLLMRRYEQDKCKWKRVIHRQWSKVHM